MRVQVFHSLEEEIQSKADDTAHGPFNRQVAFDAVNGMLTATYARLNRLQSTSTVSWMPAPRQKRLPNTAVLKAIILERISDGCMYQVDAVGVHLGQVSRPHQGHCSDIHQREDESDPVVNGYKDKVISVYNEDVRSAQADLDAHHAARRLHDQTVVLKCVAETLMNTLLHEVTADCLDADRHVQEDAECRSGLAAAQSQIRVTAASQHVSQQPAHPTNAATQGQHSEQVNMHEALVDLIGMEAPQLQIAEGEDHAPVNLEVRVLSFWSEIEDIHQQNSVT
jgi:hypothetical protein